MKQNILYVAAVLLLSSMTLLHAQEKRLTLNEALALAKEGNKTLQIQALEEIHSQEVTQEAKNGFLPGISANGVYSYYFDRQVIFLPGSFAGTTNPVQDITVGGRNVLNAYVSLYQPIIANSKVQQIKMAKINEKIENGKSEDMRSRVALQVSTHYLDMLMMNRQLELLEESLVRNEKVLKDSKSLYEQGRGLKSDTLRSSIAVGNLKSSVSYLKNTIDVSSMELKRLIGLETVEKIKWIDELELIAAGPEKEEYKLDEALVLAVKNRKDIHVQKLTIHLEQQKMKRFQAEQLPQLSLIGQYQVQAQADNLDIEEYAYPRTSFVGLQFTVPIFSGNRIKSQISQARIKSEQEEVRLTDLNNQVRTELATLLSKKEEGLLQLEIQKNTRLLAEMNLQMVEDRYKNGLGSRLELTDAELALTQAKISYFNAIYNLRINQVELHYTLGLLDL